MLNPHLALRLFRFVLIVGLIFLFLLYSGGNYHNHFWICCKIFGVFFNIMGALFAHNYPLACKKSILAKVWFDEKHTSLVNVDNSCFEINKPYFSPENRLFVAKWLAKCSKTRC